MKSCICIFLISLLLCVVFPRARIYRHTNRYGSSGHYHVEWIRFSSKNVGSDNLSSHCHICSKLNLNKQLSIVTSWMYVIGWLSTVAACTLQERRSPRPPSSTASTNTAFNSPFFKFLLLKHLLICLLEHREIVLLFEASSAILQYCCFPVLCPGLCTVDWDVY